MVTARRIFLETWLYTPLVNKITESISDIYKDKNLTIADFWCGEGRYVRAMQEKRVQKDDWYGIDISKEAVKNCSKKTMWEFAVWSTYEAPLVDASCDVICSIFSPYDEWEIVRCLKEDGVGYIAWPGSDHLYKFIEMIRDVPHKHVLTPSEERYEQLELVDTHTVRVPLSLTSNEHIQALFRMTPYYRKAPKSKQDVILWLKTLDLTADFIIDVVKKNSSYLFLRNTWK